MRSERNKNGSTEADMAHANEVFNSNDELPDNPLYISSQPMDELRYSSDQENYNVPDDKQPIDNNESSMPVYAVPKESNVRTLQVSTGDVYAQVCKPNTSKT